MSWDEDAYGPEPTQAESDRLEVFTRCGWPDLQAGPIAVTAAALGTEDEWAQSAIAYLKSLQSFDAGDGDISAVAVSAAALSCLLAYVERLEIAAGIIAAPPEQGAGGAS